MDYRISRPFAGGFMNAIFIPGSEIADRRAVAEETYRQVSTMLQAHPCVSYALSCAGFARWSELDVAVKLMLLINDGDPVPDRLIADLNVDCSTPARLEAGKRALDDSFKLLIRIGRPYTLIGHVHGHGVVYYHFIPDGQEYPLSAIADAVAAEVSIFGRGFGLGRFALGL
jgi:hypothetical protein